MLCVPTERLRPLESVGHRHLHDGKVAVGGRGIGAHVDTLVHVLVLHDEVVLIVDTGDLHPVDGVDVTQVRILLEPDSAAYDPCETMQTKLLKVGHLKDNQPVVVEELLAADHRQIGEDVAERAQAVHAVQEQELRDFAQVGEREVVIVGRLSVVNEEDAQVALDHGAVGEAVERLHVVADVETLANCNNDIGEFNFTVSCVGLYL